MDIFSKKIPFNLTRAQSIIIIWIGALSWIWLFDMSYTILFPGLIVFLFLQLVYELSRPIWLREQKYVYTILPFLIAIGGSIALVYLSYDFSSNIYRSGCHVTEPCYNPWNDLAHKLFAIFVGSISAFIGVIVFLANGLSLIKQTKKSSPSSR